MQFSKLTWSERVGLLKPALAEVLADLAFPMSTAVVVDRVARKLGTEDTNSVSSVMMKLAPNHPLAKRSEETFVLYGKECRRWIWSPGVASVSAKAAPADTPIIEAATVERLIRESGPASLGRLMGDAETLLRKEGDKEAAAAMAVARRLFLAWRDRDEQAEPTLDDLMG